LNFIKNKKDNISFVIIIIKKGILKLFNLIASEKLRFLIDIKALVIPQKKHSLPYFIFHSHKGVTLSKRSFGKIRKRNNVIIINKLIIK